MLTHSKAFSSFSVNDLQKAKVFYSEKLGIHVKDNPMGLIELHFGNSLHVMVYPKPDHTPAAYTVLNFPVDNIDNTVKEFTSIGITFEKYTGDITTDENGICRNSGGPAIAWFKDPAGNILSVMEQ